ncbi:MAG: hypothetical protein AMK74_00660 [Nitrospira bacterium SM23_35]|nr:MAG: hypothetical protein AMK74_00660 [Nitrospira bacterium SM23_35]
MPNRLVLTGFGYYRKTKHSGEGKEMAWKGSCIKLFIFILLPVLTACAPTTLKQVWKDDAYRGGHLQKILIVGVDRSDAVRKLLEDEFGEQLNAGGAEAIRSYRIFTEEEMLDKRIFASKVSELQADALLIATLKDVADTGIYETYPAVTGQGSGSYGYYLQCCQIVSIGRNVVIETRIFDAKKDRLIWSAVTETIFEGSAEVVIRSFVPVIIAELQSNTLLQ